MMKLSFVEMGQLVPGNKLFKGVIPYMRMAAMLVI